MIKPLKCNYKKYKRNFKIPISLYFIFFAILTFFLGTILEARSDLLEKYLKELIKENIEEIHSLFLNVIQEIESRNKK